MSTQASASSWTEPPWSGWIETTGDALLILEAARRGLIPRVTRRLVDNERKMINSGSVFVFDEKESGIKRWTDGFFWSPSRILGNFLLYRETDKRGSGHRGRTDDEAPSGPPEPGNQSLSRPKSDGGAMGVDKMRERSLMGSLTNSYKFKTDGLMKKTFSLHIDGVAQHLISYYRIEDVESGRLRSPSSLPELASLNISPELLDKTHFRNPPKVEIGPDGIPRYLGEADDIDAAPAMLAAPPLSSGLPLLTDARHTIDKRAAVKRFDPYGAPPNNKRQRKAKGPDDPSSATSNSTDPQQPQPLLQAPQAYPDPNIPMIQSQSQPQQPFPPHAHPHIYSTAYSMPGYYPYHHGMYPSHYYGSPAPAVPQSAQSTPSPPIPSSSTSTTPTPTTAGGSNGLQQGVTMAAVTTTAAIAPTTPTTPQGQPIAGTAQYPASAQIYPYPYPSYPHHLIAPATVSATQNGAAAATTASPSDLSATASSSTSQSQSQVQPPQQQSSVVSAQPHAAYYHSYYHGVYQYGWPYGYIAGQPQPHMPTHMQQQGQVPVPTQSTQAQIAQTQTQQTTADGEETSGEEDSLGT